MTPIKATQQLTLADLERQFDLHRVEDADFFPECSENLPDLTPLEQERLDVALTLRLRASEMEPP